VVALSKIDQALARTKCCNELVESGMPLSEALKEAHINRETYTRYLPVLLEMPSCKQIELPVPAGRKKRNMSRRR
jgi:hypothetical protein